MTIEFRCVNCNKLLRVKDESAGKKAKCPQCATVLEIPLPGAPPDDDEFELEQPAPSPFPNFAADPPGPRGKPAAATNPYQSPMAQDTGMSPGAVVASGEIVPTRMEIGPVLAHAWMSFKENLGILIGSMFLIGIVAGVGGGIIMMMALGVAMLLGRIGLILIPFAYLAAIAFGIFLQIGLHILVLKAARRQRPEIGDLFKGAPYFLSVLGAGLLFGLAYSLGLILFIVPGIIVALMFSQFLYLIIDRNVGVMDSLTISKEITTGNKVSLFLLGLAVGAIPFVAMIFVGLLGQISEVLALLMMPVYMIVMILFGPFIQMVLATAYLTMTGQLRPAK